MTSLNEIQIVLVNTSHPGNIGAAARAMKNMGLSQLRLVNPKQFPDVEATARASGADDILLAAEVKPSLNEAIADCHLVLGTSARMRDVPWPLLELREAAQQIYLAAQQNKKIAILFGQERTGLTNEELDRCHYLVTIPANPDYSSLNIAAAVQLVAYELRMAFLSNQSHSNPIENPEQFATVEGMQDFYEHLEATLISLEFLDKVKPRKLMRRLIRLFNRAQLEQQELNILRGILTAIFRDAKNRK